MNATQITPNSTALEMNTGYKARTEDEVLGPEIILFYAIFRATQATAAITGNAITIIVVLKYDFLREISTSTMVAGLALADIFSEVAPLCGPVARQFTSKPSALTPICYIRVFSGILGGYGNGYCILLLTIDRLIFIIRPLRYISIVTPMRALVATLIVWAIAICQTSLMMAFGHITNAAISCNWAEAVPRVAYFITVGQYVIITYFIIVPIYVIIGFVSYKLSRNEPDICHFPPEAQDQQRQRRSGQKLAKTIGLVLGVYLMGFSSLLIYSGIIINVFNLDRFSFGVILANRIVSIVYSSQSLLNPFIYGWKHVQFRRAYKKLLFQRQQ